jgi:hypothetical protein
LGLGIRGGFTAETPETVYTTTLQVQRDAYIGILSNEIVEGKEIELADKCPSEERPVDIAALNVPHEPPYVYSLKLSHARSDPRKPYIFHYEKKNMVIRQAKTKICGVDECRSP